MTTIAWNGKRMAGDTWLSSDFLGSNRYSLGDYVPTKIFHPTTAAKFESVDVVAVGCSGLWVLGRSAIKRLLRSDWKEKDLQMHLAAVSKRIERHQSIRLKRPLGIGEKDAISTSLLILTSNGCFKVTAGLTHFQMADVTRKCVAIGSGAKAAERAMKLRCGVVTSVLFAYHYAGDSWGAITLVAQTGNKKPRSANKFEIVCGTAVAAIMKTLRVF